jgi:outer membrane protein OmpA-like peptidoglycan-associated protein
MTMVDVPHQIKAPAAIQRNVQVSGGTNWDLSRSAIATPIRQLPDPEPVRAAQPVDDGSWAQVETLPSYTPGDNIPKVASSVSTFARKQVTLSKAGIKALKSLSKKNAYVIVGHADSDETSPSKLSWARAKNVAAVLKRSGLKVSEVKAFGADRPASRTEYAANRRVEIYALPK